MAHRQPTPSIPNAWQVEIRGTAQHSLKMYEEAVESFEAALTMNPWNTETATRLYQTERSMLMKAQTS